MNKTLKLILEFTPSVISGLAFGWLLGSLLTPSATNPVPLSTYTVYYQSGHTDKIKASSIDVEDDYIYFDNPNAGTVGLVKNVNIKKIIKTTQQTKQ